MLVRGDRGERNFLGFVIKKIYMFYRLQVNLPYSRNFVVKFVLLKKKQKFVLLWENGQKFVLFFLKNPLSGATLHEFVHEFNSKYQQFLPYVNREWAVSSTPNELCVGMWQHVIMIFFMFIFGSLNNFEITNLNKKKFINVHIFLKFINRHPFYYIFDTLQTLIIFWVMSGVRLSK